jgi:predicted ATPase
MLTSIRIQNFRSIQNASVKLGQVNLFIGPNNSGKSNFLKGIEFLSRAASLSPNSLSHGSLDINSNISRKKNQNIFKEHIRCAVEFSDKGLYPLDMEYAYHTNVKFYDIAGNKMSVSNYTHRGKVVSQEEHEVSDSVNYLKNYLADISIYRIDPTKIIIPREINPDYIFASDGSNTLSFLFNLNQEYRNEYQILESDFAKHIGTLVTISTPLNPLSQDQDEGAFKLKFFDQNGIGYWAEEVSEGVLYFLALLCIIHQPQPPKLLLLEEPEKGIHPRRIKEVMNFIFELARLRDIQIILTSHSPYVVDHFADIPECISVFDRENGETVIHNAADIIAKTNGKLQAAGEEPIRYTDALGEYWVSGFLGGVPEVFTGI